MSDVPSSEALPRLPRGVRLRHDKNRDEWLLLGPERLFKPDNIALEILKRCDGEATLGAIVEDLARTFEAPRDQVAKDVGAFLVGLAEKQMVEFA
jgi:pyrroloquinoline quinone biosynthesis protein D